MENRPPAVIPAPIAYIKRRTQRRCSKTVTVGDVTIPEGVDVIIPMVLIHHMPEYWPKPSKFDPERYNS